MKKRFNQKGFSMGEVLIVVAIIVVLAGVGFVALMSHMRNMHQLEMDGHAKEIFVAAQNHLSMAKGQDYLGLSSESDFGAVSPLTFTTVVGDETKVEKDADKGIYYLLVDDASDLTNIGVLKQMLPFGSMDEAARTGGSYIIRYQKDPGIVLDVFYAEKGTKRFAHTLKTDDYEKLMSSEYYGDAGKDKRRNYSLNGASHAVIGWYGGSTASVPTGEKLKTPGVEIENGDRLLVRVTNYNEDKAGNELVLVIGNDVKPVSIKLAGSDAASDLNAYRVTYNSTDKTYTIVLDDVTTDKSANPDKLHFAQLSTDSAFTASVPGRNIDVYAIAYNNQYLSNIAQSPTQTTNSLFASYHEADAEAAVPAYVEIASIRHLLNLDATISGLSNTVSFNIANQISDLVWDDGDTTEKNGFLDNTRQAATRIYTYNSGGTAEISEAGYYLPVNPKDTIDYRGLSGTNHITGIKVDYSGDAGLFGSLSGSVSDLELIDFDIEGTGSVGALAGSTDGANITGVLVHNSKTGGTETNTSGADNDLAIVSTGDSAGGLVGRMTDGSVKMCAAAVYVQGAANAGGLIGAVTGATVEDSYSGGHTENARYVSDTALPVTGSSATNVTVVNVMTDDGGFAGGLIGSASGTTIRYCYSTASAAPASGKATVGGLVGVTSGGSITACYAIGLVEGGTGGTASSFVGNYTSTVFSGGKNYYMESGTPNNGGYAALTSEDGNTHYVVAATVGKDLPNFFIPKADQQDAYPYDKALLVAYKEGGAGTKVLYCFPTIEQLHTKNSGSLSIGTTDAGLAAFRRSFLTKHYGDWQLPSMSPMNFMLLNGNTLDLVFELEDKSPQTLTFAVTGASSGNTRVFTVELEKGTSAWKVKSATETAVGTGITQSASKDVTAAISARFGAYEIDDEDLEDYYNASFKGKREYPATATTEAKTFYDVKITLDDITSQNGHFAQLLADQSAFAQTTESTPKPIYAQLIPGENIVVRMAGGSVGWSELKDLKFFADAESEAKNASLANTALYKLPDAYHRFACADNSIFAFYSEIESGAATQVKASTDLSTMSTADIINIRHLQNLDYDTSGVNKYGIDSDYRVTTATLQNNIDWTQDGNTAFYSSIYGKTSGTVITGSHFNGIYSPYLSNFNGNDKTISNMVIGRTYGTAGNNAGFFRLVNGSLTIQKLHFDNPTVSASDASTSYGHAGTVVAQITSGTVKLDTVLVEGEDSEVSASVSNMSAGGLVGDKSGSATLTIYNSAAAVFVTANGPAGGLLGKQTEGTVYIMKSYVGGHVGTEKSEVDPDGHTITVLAAEYYTDTPAIRMNGTEPYKDSNGAMHRWNIISNGGAAGGMIGQTVAGTTGIEMSFNTASVFSGASNMGGGIIGKAEAAFDAVPKSVDSEASNKLLDLVYTVAPVYNVKTYGYDSTLLQIDKTSYTGVNGGVFGNQNKLNSDDNPRLFYLADVYEGVQYNSAVTESTISYIGSGTPTNVLLASYFADNNHASSASIIGLNNGHENLEQQTTPYYKTLKTASNQKEYPFAIWTKFGSELHFYGDWQPVEGAGTVLFTIHFMTEDPENAIDTITMPVTSFSSGNNLFKLGVQMTPFEGAELPIPTVPYIPGYEYGNGAEGVNNVVWTVYYSDLHDSLTALTNGVSSLDSQYKLNNFTYSEVGGSVQLDESYLKIARDNYDGHLTFVAHYNKLPNQYTLKLMDSTDPSKDTIGYYKNVGGVQLITTEKTLETQRTDNGLYLPRRSKANYRFVGWYTGTVNSEGKVTLGSTPIYEINDAGVLVCANTSFTPSGDLVLYAKYEEIRETNITVKFWLEDSTNSAGGYWLDAEYTLTFDMNLGFNEDLALPGNDNGIQGIKVEKKMTADATETATVYTAPNTYNEATAEAFFKKISSSATDDEFVHINTGKHAGTTEDPYPAQYIVTIQGSVPTTGYAVVHMLEHTDADGNYTTATTPYQALITAHTTPSEYPRPSDEDVEEFEGFYLSDMPRVATRYAANNAYGIDATIDGISIEYYFVLTYSRDTFTLSFDSLGDSTGTAPFDSRDIEFGAALPAIPDPSFGGHTFKGWRYFDGEGMPQTEVPSTMPAYDLTLSAQWEAFRVGYSVAFWFENADNDGYTYLDTVVFSSTSNDHPHNYGDTVFASEFQQYTNFDGYNSIKNYMEFKDNSGRDPKGVKLAYDGSSVVNVYFKRKTFTFTFKAPYKGYYADDEGTYGLFGDPNNNSNYHTLTKTSRWFANGTVYEGTRYAKATDNNDTQYGVVNGERVGLTYNSSIKFYYYDHKETTASYTQEPVQYGTNSSGDYKPLRWEWEENKWKIKQKGKWKEYKGTRYIVEEKEYGGQLYTYDSFWHEYNQYNGDPSENHYYYGVVNGYFVSLTKTSSTAKWTYEDSNGSEVEYEGARYKITTSETGDIFGLVSGSMQLLNKDYVYTYNGQEYKGQRYSYSNSSSNYVVIYKITAKYQANIRNRWTFTGANGINYPETNQVTSWKPQGSNTGLSERLVYMDEMLGKDITFHVFHSDNTQRETLNYYVESLGDGDFTYKGTKYDLYYTSRADYTYVTNAEDFFNLKGFAKSLATLVRDSSTTEYGTTWERIPGSGHSFHDGDVMNFFYSRSSSTLTRMNGTTAQGGGELPGISVKYGDTLNKDTYKATPAKPSKLDENYQWGGWYADPNYENLFDFTQTMPVGNVVLYGKWEHIPVNVTFDANGGQLPKMDENGDPVLDAEGNQTYVSSVTAAMPWGKPLDILDSDGSMMFAYTPTRDGYEFTGWYNGDNRWVLSSDVMRPITLKAGWKPSEGNTRATVTIRYMDVSGDTPVAITTVPVGYLTSVDRHQQGDSQGKWIMVGDLLTLDVPILDNYSRAWPTSTILVSSSTDTIDFYYRKNSWTLTVNYYVQYTSITPADWVTAAAAADSVTLTSGTSDPVPVKTVTYDAASQYLLYSYKQPPTNPNEKGWEGVDLSWISGYEFDRYVYDGKTVRNTFVSISQDGPKVLDVYLVPDPDAMEIKDYVCYYDAVTKLNTTVSSPLKCPAGATAGVHCKYYYYDSTDKQYKLATTGDQVKDAGTYGMREYLTVTVNGKNYLVWQSDGGSKLNQMTDINDIPPLHLYIRRRIVIMQSATPTAPTYYEGILLTANGPNDVTDNFTSYSSLNLESFEEGLGFAKITNEEGAVTYQEGASYVFSANSFRRVVGTTPNVFTYDLNANTKESNYNFFLFYGRLTIKAAASGE